jgi:hypothetical protein
MPARYRSALLDAVAADPRALAAAVAASRLAVRQARGIAREELRLVRAVGADGRYASLVAFLDALARAR